MIESDPSVLISIEKALAVGLLKGKLSVNHPLNNLTSWRVGGAAKLFYQPQSIEDISALLTIIPVDEPVLWLGLGSNILIRDGGFEGLVIATLGRLNTLTALSETTVRAEAGVSCATFARQCARWAMTGCEFLATVPGTVGGALKMNAGAFGGETWQYVSAVETLDRKGQIHKRTPKAYQITYRQVDGPLDEWFVAGHFCLEPGDKTESLAKIRQITQQRAQTQPTDLPSCGSVFRNPPDDYAARLIEETGLKGFSLGGACVSTKHANFIINEGSATARDIEDLIERVAEKVHAAHGIQLQQEVHVVGRP